MNVPVNILTLRDLSVSLDGASGPGFSNLNSTLAAGDLVVALLEKEPARSLLADAAEGLVAPTQGVVTFLGEDWQTMTPDRAARQRGRIGRVFEGECWLSDLDVDQDITLAERHHTRRVRKDIDAEARQLCRDFGLQDLPRGRSSGIGWQDLRKASFVRAFLGAPVLILLENPTSGLYADVIAPLLKTVHAARQRGVAVLWTTDQLEVWNHPELRATARCRMEGSQLQLMAETGLGGLMKKHFQFRHVNEITGTFVIVVVLVLIAALMWTGRSQRWFKSNVNVRIVLPEDGAAGIRQGSEVYFLGTLVGSVAGVEVVDEKGRMEARAKIRRDFFLFIRADSSAVVKKKFGVAGDSFFEITRGEGKPLPEEGASIVCKEQFQSALEAAVEQIRHEALLVLTNVNSGLDTWTKLGADLGGTRQHLDGLAVRLENIAAGVEAGKGTVGKLITDTALADEAQKLLARANEALSELQGMMTNLNVAVKNVQDGTARLPEITDTVANEVKNLPGLVQQTQTSMRELERLIEALQRHWLLRKYVNKTNPPPFNPGSEPVAPEKKPAKPRRSPGDSSQ